MPDPTIIQAPAPALGAQFDPPASTRNVTYQYDANTQIDGTAVQNPAGGWDVSISVAGQATLVEHARLMVAGSLSQPGEFIFK